LEKQTFEELTPMITAVLGRKIAWGIAITAFAFSISWARQPQTAKQEVPVTPGNNQSMNCSIGDGFTLAAVGDLLINQPESNLADPGFQAAIRIVRRADAGFGNFEGTAIDMRRFQGYPAAENGGAWVIDSPAVPADLKRMGFTIVSRANNHTTDWGLAGMRETDRRLTDAGVVFAGDGYDLTAAQAPHYLATAQGRVAIVSMASSFTPLSRAMDPLGAAPGRPGIDALRTTHFLVVPQRMFDQVRKLHDEIVAALPKAEQDQIPKSKDPNVVNLFGTRYRLGKRVGVSFRMNQADLKGILKGIRQGKENSDFVIATIHAHEPGNWSAQPPDFLPKLAHDAINAGADEFIGHGPHQLRGIEIYKGKPIFYSLGNFFFQSSMEAPVGVDAYRQFHLDPGKATDEEQNAALDKKWFSGNLWYQGVIAVSRFDHGEVSEIRLYPVVLGAMRRAADRGIPRLAPPADARVILQRLQRLSAPFGTRIEIKASIGVIHPQK
jgi:poly-gamma-glutamate capsule biosynthesis protein CapA/YwtB (metallophosphatase superfamily)